ncbi:MAG: glycosyltransferase [Candidatus Omnitrophica bacterium]|nr:glycosyltransferase [Candidatus Omnitrophota bacterium]MBU1924742.1 glycosyltransferase [Candidatus Omnitrophota bacterium]
MDKTSQPKVSVIIPTHNSQSIVEECLDSILNQDYPNLELIVVDDASKDETLIKIARYPVKSVSNSKNYGAAYSRNIGVKNMDLESEIVIFIDSDIRVPTMAVSSAVKVILQKPEILAVGGIYSQNSQSFNFITDFKNMDLAYRGSIYTPYVKYLGSFFFAIKKSTFLKAGGFSTDFSGSSVEDVEFSYRVTRGKNLMFINKNILVDHLKTYTLFTMLKVDFQRVINLIKIIKKSKGKYKAGEQAPLPYIINLFLPGLILLAAIVEIKFKFKWLNLYLLLIFIINNWRFLFFLFKKRGIIFSIKSIGVLFIEYIVVEIAILASFFIAPIKEGIV